MHLISSPRRSRRAHEWSNAKAVTFIVTLASGRPVTLAARAAGMSRKSAYALKSREPAFRMAWEAAVSSSASKREARPGATVQRPVAVANEGDNRTRAPLSSVSTSSPHAARRAAELARDRFFAGLARSRPQQSPRPAGQPPFVRP